MVGRSLLDLRGIAGRTGNFERPAPPDEQGIEPVADFCDGPGRGKRWRVLDGEVDHVHSQTWARSMRIAPCAEMGLTVQACLTVVRAIMAFASSRPAAVSSYFFTTAFLPPCRTVTASRSTSPRS